MREKGLCDREPDALAATSDDGDDAVQQAPAVSDRAPQYDFGRPRTFVEM